jgi:long-chain-alcohol oxidase
VIIGADGHECGVEDNSPKHHREESGGGEDGSGAGGPESAAGGGGDGDGSSDGGGSVNKQNQTDSNNDKDSLFVGTPSDQAQLAGLLERSNSVGLPLHGVGLFSAHQMGTCRMGSDCLASVVDCDGESWDVDDL